MSFVAQYSNVSNSGSLTLTFTLPSAISTGNTLVLGVLSRRITAPGTPWTVADSRGNTWTYDTGVLSTVSTGVYTALYHCKPTTALQAGDTVTVTALNPQICWTGAVAQFSDVMISIDGSTATSTSPSANTNVSVGAITTTSTIGLLVSSVGLESTAAIATGTNGWAATSLVTSTSGSDDRGLQLMYRYTTSGGPYSATATLSNGAIWTATLRGLMLQGSTPTISVWNGTAEVAATVTVWNGTAEVAANVASIV